MIGYPSRQDGAILTSHLAWAPVLVKTIHIDRQSNSFFYHVYLPFPWIIEETGLETIGHVQCIVHADWLRAFFNMVEPSGNL